MNNNILDFQLELIKKKKMPKIFQSILCRMDKWNLFFSTNVLLFDVLTILINRFVLFFSILSQKQKFYVKRKNNSWSSCMIFFHILCPLYIYFKRLVIYKSNSKMNMSNTCSYYSLYYIAIQSSM